MMEIIAILVIFVIMYLIAWGTIESMYVEWFLWVTRRQDEKRKMDKVKKNRVE